MLEKFYLITFLISFPARNQKKAEGRHFEADVWSLQEKEKNWEWTERRKDEDYLREKK